MISHRTEAHAAHNFAWLQQSLEDQSHNDAKVLEETKAHEAADKESTGNIDLLKVIKSDLCHSSRENPPRQRRMLW